MFYVFLNECSSFFCDFIFYGRITLWPINYAAKIFVVKMLGTKMLMAKLPRTSISMKQGQCLLLANEKCNC